MAGQVQWPWLDGQANVPGIVEKICPESHISQNQWQPGWNQVYWQTDYDYISDYECVFNYPINVADNIGLYGRGIWDNLQADKQQGTHVPITNLAHFTSPANAEKIIENGGFRGGMKKINEDAQGNDITAKFSWWSPILTGERDKNQVRRTLGAAIQPFLGQYDDQDNLQNQFATSDAFTPNPRRYGSRYFQYSINELFEYYENMYSIHDELQFKIMGTFGYKVEIMHAVLVCSQADGDGRFGAYPPVLKPEEDVNNEAVVTRDGDGNWIWKPQATGTEITRLQAHWQYYPMYRRWENVAFAFHIPDEWGNDLQNETFMAVPNLRDHLHVLPRRSTAEKMKEKR
ncbi:hypothetical protein OS493_031239 [Desmophyllum pertusum]|uniref:Uncharacterized protein n=1 Tax=Desmophyllum pertusum TaxID=174260 RepID=A0A9W9Z8C2_9CNID|nr:hypothetical protein OS493_031239 [Desmophyllum pertusum]